jgi:hypothetical protein
MMFDSIQLRALITILATGLLLVVATTAAAEDTGLFTNDVIRGYEYQGPYAQFGVSVGRVDFDGSGVDSDASGGFTMTGGYRALPWLALEGNFSFLGGKDNVEVGPFEGDTEFWAFTFGPKVYPLGFFEGQVLPDALQPYGLIQIGGGQIEIDGPGGSNFDEDSFIARFIIGFDIWATDSLGFFVEGGGFAVEEDDVDGAGVFTIGGQFRF